MISITDQYNAMYEDSGATQAENYLECASWLEGFMIGANMTGTPLERCIATLRSGGNFVAFCKSQKV
jgi:hypothetical protein